MKKITQIKEIKGGVMVEFALILPIFLVLVFGVIEFSLMLYDKTMITNAGREAARSGIALRSPALTNGTNPTLTTYVQGVASTYCGTHLITFGSSGSSCTTTLYSTYPTSLNTTGASKTQLTVKVDYTYTYLVFGDLISLLNKINNGTWNSSSNLSSMIVMNFE